MKSRFLQDRRETPNDPSRKPEWAGPLVLSLLAAATALFALSVSGWFGDRAAGFVPPAGNIKWIPECYRGGVWTDAASVYFWNRRGRSPCCFRCFSYFGEMEPIPGKRSETPCWPFPFWPERCFESISGPSNPSGWIPMRSRPDFGRTPGARFSRGRLDSGNQHQSVFVFWKRPSESCLDGMTKL